MIVSIGTMVSLGLHVLSDHFWGIAGVHYKVKSINPAAFAGAACTYFILHNIIGLQLGLYVAIWHGFYVLKHLF